MDRQQTATRRARLAGILLAALLAQAGLARGHCGTVNGPVVQAAKTALQTGGFSKVQVWVGDEQEKELRETFEKVLRVRKLEGQAKELADRCFFETAVRLRREAEGMSYAGLKPAGPLPPDIEAAEKALSTRDSEPVVNLLISQLRSSSTSGSTARWPPGRATTKAWRPEVDRRLRQIRRLRPRVVRKDSGRPGPRCGRVALQRRPQASFTVCGAAETAAQE